MAKRQQLLDLADRVEREEPSRELDAAIENLLAGGSAADLAYIIEDLERTTRPPAYTTSLDTAVTLVPKGIVWALYSGSDTYVASAACEPKPAPGRLMDERWGAEGATEAAALTAAALRALAQEARDGE